MYYTRTMCGGRRWGVPAWAVAVALATVVPVAAQPAPGPLPPGVAALAAGLEAHREQYAPGTREPVSIQFLFKDAAGTQAARAIDITKAALALFDAWYGPYPYAQLTVVDAPWNSGAAGTSLPGVVVISTRWLSVERDRALERSIVAGISRHYWADLAPPEGTGFQEGLVLFSATRAIHELLEGRNFAAQRYLGGFVPLSIRSLLLSPNPADARPRLGRFDEVDRPSSAAWRYAAAGAGGEAARAAVSLQTLERYVGWPSLQQALWSYRDRLRSPGAAADLAGIMAEQRGRDMRWFFTEAFCLQARFDYAVEDAHSGPAPGAPAAFRTGVVLRRLGNGVFAGTSEPRGPLAGARAIPVAVLFEDGTEHREWWDGRDQELRLAYDSASRALSVSVDPEQFLLLDADRSNNTRRLTPRFFETGARLASQWVLWLQDVMLSYTAVL